MRTVMKKPIEEIEKIAEDLVGLSIQDLTALVDVLKTKYNLVPVQQTTVAAVKEKESEEEKVIEKTSFDVVLTNRLEGSDKLNSIKALKDVINVGLKDAQQLISAELPAVLKANCAKSEAESIKAALEPFGAKIELR